MGTQPHPSVGRLFKVLLDRVTSKHTLDMILPIRGTRPSFTSSKQEPVPPTIQAVCKPTPRQSADSMQFLSNYQWNSSQNYNNKKKKKPLKFVWKHKGPPHRQRHFEKEKCNCRDQTPRIQTVLQS